MKGMEGITADARKGKSDLTRICRMFRIRQKHSHLNKLKKADN